MRPCRKTANSMHAARYLKRAESIARSIQSNTAIKRNIIDGCIVEGRKVGNNLAAMVLEPEGHILALMANVNMDQRENKDIKFLAQYKCPSGVSDPYRPSTPIANPLSQSEESISVGVRSRTIYIGSPPAGNTIEPVYPGGFGGVPHAPEVGYLIVPPSIHAGEHFIYRASYVHDSNATGSYFIRVMVLSSVSNYSVLISQQVIRQLADGRSIDPEALGYWSRRISIIETGRGSFTLIFNTGVVIGEHGGGTLRAERLLRLDIDLKLTENAVKREQLADEYDPEKDWVEPDIRGSLFPLSLVPENLQPDTVLVYTGGDNQTASIPAISAMSIADIALDADGEVVAAVKWEVKRQDGTLPNLPYIDARLDTRLNHICWGIGVSAFGLASWGGTKSFFDVHSKEVFAPNFHGESDLVYEHEVDPDNALLGERMLIFNGNVHRWVSKIDRVTITRSITNSPIPFDFVAPYTLELINGIPRAADTGEHEFGDIVYAGAGFQYNYGASINPGNNNFYLHSSWAREAVRDAKCMVSKSAIAIAAGGKLEVVSNRWIRSESQGIAFIEGNRRRFEKINEGQMVPEYRVITVTCHQREVRNDKDELVSPAIIIVGAYYKGQPSILIRKGPIWEEDMDENGYEFARFWTVEKALNHSYNFYFYMGNLLMGGKYGQMFEISG